MEEQKPELAAEQQPAASESQQSQPTAPVAEPRHPLQDILDKAAKKAEEAQPQTPPTEGLAPKAPEAWSLDKWDGNPATLPDKLKKIVSDNQAAFTQKAQEMAQLKQAYEALKAQVETTSRMSQQPLISQEEFEAAQLDPQKFMELTKKVASMELEKEKAALQPLLQDIQMKQLISENEARINSFATEHPDFWDLHGKGLIEPFVQMTGDLEASYQRARQIADNFKQTVKTELTKTVQAKKSAASLTPTTPQQVEVVYVDPGTDTTFVAAKYAMEGKRVKVQVRPN